MGNNIKSSSCIQIQPMEYSPEELKKLKEFVEAVKNDDARSALACWGDHHDYSHGY